MAVYKVPQDVEADDKLIGPFSFRQFIYLIIVAIAGFVAWILAQIFIGLIVIPLPIIILFAALALPLKKDQPMETYLVAIVRFYLKPRLRIWAPEGAVSLVTITAPKVAEQHLTKDFGGEEAQQRLSYLSQIVDSQGWSTRGVTSAPVSTSLADDVAAEAESAHDVMDDGAGVSMSIDSLIEQQSAIRQQQVRREFQQAAQQAPVVMAPAANSVVPDDSDDVSFDPYPTSIHQHVVTPGHGKPTFSPPVHKPVDTSKIVSPPKRPDLPLAPEVSPDIMRLANNNDLSISAIAHEAHRLEDKDGSEVVISLR